MFKPSEKSLSCYVIKGEEGIGPVCSGNVTYDEFVRFFAVADTSVSEIDKVQRDTAPSRVTGVEQYLLGREDTTFPEVFVITTHFDFSPISAPLLNGVSEPGVLTLPTSAERMLVDGQGRRLGVEKALAMAGSLGSRTIGVKFFATGTDSLLDAKKTIRQIFADYHRKVIKPNASINLFFDGSERAATFVFDAYEHLRKQGFPMEQLVSLEGNTKCVYTLAQFKDFLSAFTGLSAKQVNQSLADAEHANLYLSLVSDFFEVLMTVPVFAELDTQDIKVIRKSHLLCCAIGLSALGHLARNVIDGALVKQQPVNFSVLAPLATMDFAKTAKRWVGKVVTEDEKMIKGTARKMAAMMSSELGLPLTEDLLLSIAS